MIRVASVPSDHPYVAHISPPDGEVVEPHVIRLPDPPVAAEDGSTRWWPPRFLDAGFLEEHLDEFDILHIHFGFESFTPEQLQVALDVARDAKKPVVLTVHDLRNPHLRDEDAQLERLDVLVPRADAIITLTDGVARVIAQRWNREAQVIPHPHIVDLTTMKEAAHPSKSPHNKQSFKIGLHLKSLRTNTDAMGALRALEKLHQDYPEQFRGIVTIHTQVMNPQDRGYAQEVAQYAYQLTASDIIDLVEHEPMNDEALYAHLRTLDISVMPYTWGTHSGWIEMCHDLGIKVVAPDVGFFREQHDPTLFTLTTRDGEPRIDPNSLANAIREACRISADDPRSLPASPDARLKERRQIARKHAAIYENCLKNISRQHG